MARKKSESLFGAIVVRNFNITLKTLQVALDQQKESGEMLGNVLISMGVLSKEQVLMALHRQMQMRQAEARDETGQG